MINFDKISTGTGDKGETELPGGRKVRKDDIIIETLGTLDKFNSYLGLIRAMIQEEKLRKEILSVQKKIFTICSWIASNGSEKLNESKKFKITEKDITDIEEMEKELIKKTEKSSNFVTPGASVLSAHIDFARTLCRELERRVVTCTMEKGINLELSQRYLNRLSDYLFIMARYAEKNLT